MKNVECPTCGGDGKVHSHNDKCWTCDGRGTCSAEKAEAARASEARLAPRLHTGDYQ